MHVHYAVIIIMPVSADFQYECTHLMLCSVLTARAPCHGPMVQQLPSLACQNYAKYVNFNDHARSLFNTAHKTNGAITNSQSISFFAWWCLFYNRGSSVSLASAKILLAQGPSKPGWHLFEKATRSTAFPSKPPLDIDQPGTACMYQDSN
jgi:hypothetical protein